MGQGNDARGAFQQASGKGIRIPGSGRDRPFIQILDHGRIALVAAVAVRYHVAVAALEALAPGHGMGGVGREHHEGLGVLGSAFPILTDCAHGQRLVICGVDFRFTGLDDLEVHQKAEAQGGDLPIEALVVVELAVEVAAVTGGVGLHVAGGAVHVGHLQHVEGLAAFVNLAALVAAGTCGGLFAAGDLKLALVAARLAQLVLGSSRCDSRATPSPWTSVFWWQPMQSNFEISPGFAASMAR